MSIINLVPEATLNVAPELTMIRFNLVNAILPDAASDSTVTDVPVPIV